VIKKLISSAVTIGLVTLAGCSGNSPTPKPIPTPAATSWGISLAADSYSLVTNQQVNLVATVTKNGQSAPDGTTVEFDASDGVFVANGKTTASVATSGGKAVIVFTSTKAGTFTIRARVSGISTTATLVYKEPSSSSELAIYSVVPNQGPLAGGNQATFYGKNITTPVDVYFIVNNNSFAAQIVSVDGGGVSATVLTPQITGVDTSKGWQADIRFVSGVGTAYEQTVTLPGAYQFLPTSAVPEIYQVFPDHGSARGGEQVTIFGQNFRSPVQVTFTAAGQTLDAQEVTVSSDGKQITLITPQLSVTPLQQDESATVTVVSGAGTAQEKTVSKADAFVFTADQLTPNISSVSPNSGPVTGGTQVTIFGSQTSNSGFQTPVQVTFGGGGIPEREAQVVSVNLHEIVCIAPDVSTDVQAAGVTLPFAVDVKVTNVDSGLNATASGAYTYGESLFISGNTPSEGRQDEVTTVTVYGSGFAAPLEANWLGVTPSQALDVTSVSGSEVVVRMPGMEPRLCEDTTGQYQITETGSGLSAEGGSFTYLGNTPTIFSIDGSSVTAANDGSSVISPAQMVIHGRNFNIQDPNGNVGVRITINGVVLQSGDYTVNDEQTITITNIPTPNQIGLTYATVDCTDTGGNAGTRVVGTPVDISVTNVDGGCADTLAGGVTYVPQDTTTCVVAP